LAKFLCVCGHSLSTSGLVPNPDEYHCLSDSDFEAFTGLVNAEDIYGQSTVMYRCPASGHLWIFWKGLDEPPTLYASAELPPGWA
jgi:hypothetical protein